MRKLQKKIAEENVQKAVKVATEAAEVATSDGKAFSICRVDVGLDAAAVREAVLKVLELVITVHFADDFLAVRLFFDLGGRYLFSNQMGIYDNNCHIYS